MSPGPLVKLMWATKTHPCGSRGLIFNISSDGTFTFLQRETSEILDLVIAKRLLELLKLSLLEVMPMFKNSSISTFINPTV